MIKFYFRVKVKISNRYNIRPNKYSNRNSKEFVLAIVPIQFCCGYIGIVVRHVQTNAKKFDEDFNFVHC